jgi:hypothetical protein
VDVETNSANPTSYSIASWEKSDKKYHIYDLTIPKERNTPNRINGFGRPVGNALTKGVSSYSIPDTTKTVNKNLSAIDIAYLEAVERGDMETAQKLVDKAAKKAGYRVKAYHGTPTKGITSFDSRKIGSNTDSGIFGRGFYTYKFMFNRLKDTEFIYPAAMSHSVILDGFLCHGVVGMSIITTAVVRFYTSLFETRKQLKIEGKDRSISGFILAVGIAVSLYGLMDTTFVWVQTGMILLFFTAGLGVEDKLIEN